jgi:cytochrome c oxidase assembly protein subunit 15
VIHRNMAYLLTFLLVIFSLQWIRKQVSEVSWLGYMLVGIIVVQVVLGIMILLNSIGSIPVFYGVMHQGIGILLLLTLVYIYLRTKLINI